MNLPAVVARTYNAFKEDSGFRKLLKQMGRKILKIRDPLKRARFVHSKIDEEIEQLFKDESVEKLVSCKQGCNACCHTQVAVSEDEAIILADIIEKGHSIDWTKLFVQAKTGNSSKDFFQLPYSMRGCVFLDKSGSCSVYEDRPSVCRTNHVVSNPEKCIVENGNESSVKLLNTFGADSWIYSLFSVSESSGALPYMLKKVMNKNKSKKRTNNPSLDL